MHGGMSEVNHIDHPYDLMNKETSNGGFFMLPLTVLLNIQ
jgi:hypothetical protein